MFRTTVDSILSSLNKNIKALDNLEARLVEDAELNETVAGELLVGAGKYRAEAGRAANVAAKIRTLIS